MNVTTNHTVKPSFRTVVLVQPAQSCDSTSCIIPTQPCICRGITRASWYPGNEFCLVQGCYLSRAFVVLDNVVLRRPILIQVVGGANRRIQVNVGAVLYVERKRCTNVVNKTGR